MTFNLIFLFGHSQNIKQTTKNKQNSFQLSTFSLNLYFPISLSIAESPLSKEKREDLVASMLSHGLLSPPRHVPNNNPCRERTRTFDPPPLSLFTQPDTFLLKKGRTLFLNAPNATHSSESF